MGSEFSEALLPPPFKRIRRYMDFTKFISLLENSALFFPAATLLPDRSEGLSLTKKELTIYQAIERIKLKKGEPLKAIPFKEVEAFNAEQENRKNYVVISSWYESMYESYAMWKTYASEGVCIVSSRAALKKALSHPEVKILEVSYGSKPDIEPSYLAPFFRKKPAYEFEKEVRAVINLYEKYGKDDSKWREPEFLSLIMANGLPVKVDLNTLIHSVVISPLTLPWFKKLVQDVCKRYDIKANIVESELQGEIS